MPLHLCGGPRPAGAAGLRGGAGRRRRARRTSALERRAYAFPGVAVRGTRRRNGRVPGPQAVPPGDGPGTAGRRPRRRREGEVQGAEASARVARREPEAVEALHGGEAERAGGGSGSGDPAQEPAHQARAEASAGGPAGQAERGGQRGEAAPRDRPRHGARAPEQWAERALQRRPLRLRHVPRRGRGQERPVCARRQVLRPGGAAAFEALRREKQAPREGVLPLPVPGCLGPIRRHQDRR
mmetsp:Transcript_16284/g.52120  ORF Transcript_16284/g.52120 Transcript_16284/m.52120 type:complete len:240 (+) Transcript_16284:217-936(+)